MLFVSKIIGLDSQWDLALKKIRFTFFAKYLIFHFDIVVGAAKDLPLLR